MSPPAPKGARGFISSIKLINVQLLIENRIKKRNEQIVV